MSNSSKGVETVKTNNKAGRNPSGPIDPVAIQKDGDVAMVRGNSYENPLGFLKAIETNRRSQTEEYVVREPTKQAK